MSAPCYVVAIVLDQSFGEELRKVARQYDVWTVPSLINKAVVERLWAEREAGRNDHQVTMWSRDVDTRTEEAWSDLLADIELHHGQHSHNPPVSELAIFGAQPTAEARKALGEYGYHRIELTAGGFHAARSSADTRPAS